MLPVHATFKYLLSVLAIIIVFNSCSYESEKNLAVIRTLEESLDNSNRLLTVSTSEYITSLSAKLDYMRTHERAKVWIAKARSVESMSKEINDYIQKIKSELLEKGLSKFLSQNEDRIYDSLKNYEKKVLAVDERIYKQFSKSLVVVSSILDTVGKNGSDPFKTFFDNASAYSSKALLTQLQNNIKVMENKVIIFCHEQVGSSGGPCTFISAITVQSSSIVQPGERIEIHSGVGEFNTYYKPEVFVYGKPVPVDVYGMATCRLRAPAKHGKYYVPVTVKYTDQDGRRQNVSREIEYTVANIEKQ